MAPFSAGQGFVEVEGFFSDRDVSGCRAFCPFESGSGRSRTLLPSDLCGYEPFVGESSRPHRINDKLVKCVSFSSRQRNVGSIGKLADLVVLDRDYMTVPASEIKRIKPTMTMVGGRVVFEAANAKPRAAVVPGQ